MHEGVGVSLLKREVHHPIMTCPIRKQFLRYEMRRPAQANQHNRPDGVYRKHVLGVESLGGAEHMSRLGTRSKAEKKWPN